MTKKISQIIINAQTIKWDKEQISFEEVVKIAFPKVKENEIAIYTITYINGPKQNEKGNMSINEKVHVTDGMIFTCTCTSQS